MKVINKKFEYLKNQLESIIENFDVSSEYDYEKRNKIRSVKIDDLTINIKSFKIPNLINKIAYRFFRKSKAQRSYEYANILTEKKIGTPQPIAYYENRNFLGLLDSYYVCEHLSYDLTYRELVTDTNYPDHENILRQFTKFTWQLHEKGIYFKDHSPGNTLIIKNDDTYSFFLVDLNRMSFFELDLDDRMKNFSRLTPKKEMVEIMSDAYAKLSGGDFKTIFEKMWFYTNQFQEKYHRKKRLKQKYLGKK